MRMAGMRPDGGVVDATAARPCRRDQPFRL
jgi:hypothetical protein